MESADGQALAAPEGHVRSRSLSIREVARRVKRDVKAVHTDVTALLKAGVLDRDKDGRIIFPFDSLKVEFLLHAA
jgi:predicted transcriptional regulator